MSKYAHLKHAPVTEALIDLHVKLPGNVVIDDIKELHAAVADQYPEFRERKVWEGRIELKSGESTKHVGKDKIDGYICTSSDNKQVVQFRMDGFTFSRLKPYETWEQLRDEANRLWQLYKKSLVPETITRIAVRYVNNLNIPLPIKDFSDYMTAPPSVPADLPQGVSSFVTRNVIHESSLNVNAIITQALERIVDLKNAPIILDIDVFKHDPDGIDDEIAWKILEDLREFKNKIFFKSITEKAKELYL